MDGYAVSSSSGSGGRDSVFLDGEQMTTPSLATSASSGSSGSSGSSSASAPSSHLSAGSSSSPASSCRHGFAARSPRLSSNASTITSGSEASAASSTSSHSSSSQNSGSWGSLAKHCPLKTSESGEDSLVKVLDKLPHTSQSLRHVVSNLSRTYDDDVLANVQQFNEQAKSLEINDTPRPHLKLRRQTQGKHEVSLTQLFTFCLMNTSKCCLG